MSIEIEHIHFQECDSTQTRLENYLKKGKYKENLLVSSLFQTLGRGRHGNTWDSVENSLAISFRIKANSVLTLTSLEIGSLLCDFFNEYNLKLKWPNDLLSEDGKKCGGILCQNISGYIHVGIGINLGKSEKFEPSDSLKFGRSGICEINFTNEQLKETAYDLYNYILNNRLTSQNVIRKWSSHCFHLNKEVKIEDSSFSIVGEFIGIGDQGQALIKESGQIKKFFSGSLYLI